MRIRNKTLLLIAGFCALLIILFFIIPRDKQTDTPVESYTSPEEYLSNHFTALNRTAEILWLHPELFDSIREKWDGGHEYETFFLANQIPDLLAFLIKQYDDSSDELLYVLNHLNVISIGYYFGDVFDMPAISFLIPVSIDGKDVFIDLYYIRQYSEDMRTDSWNISTIDWISGSYGKKDFKKSLFPFWYTCINTT